MKVLILHQHFKIPQQGGAIRSYYLAKALVDHSIQVSVVTVHNERKYKREIVEGIEVHYLPIAYNNRFGFSERGFSFMKYVLSVIRRPSLYRKVDICYAISTPLTTGIAALWMKWVYKVPFIFEVGDLWPDAPVQLGFIKNPVLRWLLYRLEKVIYKNAQSVVALSTSIQKSVKEKVTEKCVHLIPNMSDTAFYKPEPKRPELETKFGTAGKFVVSYIGAAGFANGLDYFLEIARASQRATLPVKFILCGDGAMLEGLVKSALHLDLQNFSFIPFQNRSGVKDLMNISDASFICYRPFPILETGSPNKYFDALAAGKLVITNFKGWIKEEIERNGCGMYVDQQHPTDFIKKITPFLEDNVLLKRNQQAGRALAEREYSRSLLGKKFVNIFKRMR